MQTISEEEVLALLGDPRLIARTIAETKGGEMPDARQEQELTSCWLSVTGSSMAKPHTKYADNAKYFSTINSSSP